MSQCQGQISLFSAEAFHDLANHLALPGSSEARKMTATSGQKWLGLSKSSGQLGLLEKMLLESLGWYSPIFYLNWKPVDIGQGHFLFQLALSEPDTGDTELPLWATPTAQDYKRRGPNGRQQGLPEQVKLWPTPKASLRGDCPSERNRRSPDLSAAVKMFPTPTTGAGMCRGTGNFQQLNKLKEQGVISEDERRSMSQGNGGQLNPHWVEWLMGFPPRWTEI